MDASFLKIGGVVVALVGVLGFKFYNKSQSDTDVKQEAHRVVKRLSCYASDPAYLDGLVERFHPVAFDGAYTMGGRRRSASFDTRGYLRTLVTSMSRQAENDRRAAIADELRDVASRLR